ncbi:DMT family transporter [Priestia endophytica]|jgi:multidrug resistance protein EbrA|uniref:DMT family transporter n=1 Tax=Priestia endophytica TaxID=135735 RepID=UPI002040E60C|nr:multidrug efflux SMR transporter [Priestia endophytica]MCM3538346.1 multidrug efflux SMR transporter [Priestia endophytica]
MNAIILLAFAIICEVFGSTMLKKSEGFKKVLPSIGVVTGMGLAFYFLSLAIRTLPIGTVYAIWAGAGTALTTLVGVIVFKDHFNLKKGIGLTFIICGVIALKISTGQAH